MWDNQGTMKLETLHFEYGIYHLVTMQTSFFKKATHLFHSIFKMVHNNKFETKYSNKAFETIYLKLIEVPSKKQ